MIPSIHFSISPVVFNQEGKTVIGWHKNLGYYNLKGCQNQRLFSRQFWLNFTFTLYKPLETAIGTQFIIKTQFNKLHLIVEHLAVQHL